MLEEIRFKAGTVPGAAPLVAKGARFTVLVGPNNSGKSVALQEIYASVRARPNDHLDNSVIDKATWTKPATVDEYIEIVSKDARTEELNGTKLRVRNDGDFRFTLDHLRGMYNEGPHWHQMLGNASALRLDGTTRLELLNGQKLGNLKEPGNGVVQALFRNDGARARLRECTARAFGKYLVVDPTDNFMGQVRLSETPPPTDGFERSLDDPAVAYHSAAGLITGYSDGVRAYSGILAAVLAMHYRLILIDEPEAFLHPALARTLGHELASIGQERGVSYVVATHSADFLLGCLETGEEVQVARLTWDGRYATARLLDSGSLRNAMRDPLLRSMQTVSGLFSRGCVVTEGDTDRAYYQEIYYRVGHGDKNYRDALFLNAQNKQTVRKPVTWLRAAGVPAAAIVDLDVLKCGGKEWTDLLGACGVPAPLHQGMADMRARSYEMFKTIGADPKRVGIEGLPDAEQRAALIELLEQLGGYGLFVVPGGEVESWMRELDVGGHGPPWLVNIFEKMGSDPETSGYVRPSQDGVWAFIRSVCHWLENPARKGMSSAV